MAGRKKKVLSEGEVSKVVKKVLKADPDKLVAAQVPKRNDLVNNDIQSHPKFAKFNKGESY